VYWTGRSSLWEAFRKLGLTTIVVATALAASSSWARSYAADSAVVSLAELPIEAQRTERLIRQGGPFPFAKDGVVFGNRERQLPRRQRGFYREYTVRTLGASDRGARRIVCGGQQPRNPEACYYSDDHYASFRRIAP
jgi:ribonuclease T1